MTNFENLTRAAFLACFDPQPSQEHTKFPLFAIASDKRCVRQGPTCVCPRRPTEPSRNKSTGRTPKLVESFQRSSHQLSRGGRVDSRMMKRHRRIQPGLGKWFLAAAIAPDLTRNARCTIAENRGRCGFRNLTKPALKHNNSSKACLYYFWA